jgi:hypothetical protein
MDSYLKRDIMASKCRSTVICRATGYGLDDMSVGVRVLVGSRILAFLYRPVQLWSLPSLLCKEYWGFLPRGQSDRNVKLTSHLRLMSRSRKYGSIHPLPHTSSWRSAKLINHRDNFTSFFIILPFDILAQIVTRHFYVI